MAKYYYARVSKKDMNETRQIESFLKIGADTQEIFIDKKTGKNFDRPKYKELKNILKPGDELYVHELDRLGRNKSMILEEIRWFQTNNITLRSLDIPTTLQEYSSENRLIGEMINNILIEVYATLAQQELERKEKRQREAIDAMPIDEETGKILNYGRKATTIEDVKPYFDYFELVEEGHLTPSKAMKLMNVKKTTFYKYKKIWKDSLKQKNIYNAE